MPLPRGCLKWQDRVGILGMLEFKDVYLVGTSLKLFGAQIHSVLQRAFIEKALGLDFLLSPVTLIPVEPSVSTRTTISYVTSL